MSEKRLLFFSLEDWTEIRRRNQFFCTLLHDRHPDSQILWVGPTPYWLNRMKSQLAQGGPLKPGMELPQARPEYPRIFTLQPCKVLPNSIGRNINEQLLFHHVKRSIEHLGWQNYAIWINNQSLRKLLPPLKGTDTIYDITDDWTQCNLPQRMLDSIREDDAWLLEYADEVIACSNGLFEEKRKQRERVNLIRNAIEVELYAPDKVKELTIPADVLGIPKPIAGYTGTLHDDRLDVDLLTQVLQANPDLHLVFIGPDRLSAGSRQGLTQFPNCHILGGRPHESMPAYLAAFDVCIAPHKVNKFTDSLDPLKLYEYMATGKPIVATSCAGFRDEKELVCLAEHAAEFAAGVRSSLTAPDQSEARVAWARRNSWTSRISEVERILGWSPVSGTAERENQHASV